MTLQVENTRWISANGAPSIQDVMTDKLYTSDEFKKVKEIFTVGQ